MQLPCPGKPSGLVGLFLLSVLILPALVRADVIIDLNDKARVAFNSSGQNVVLGMMQMAYVHAAIYDAVNAIDGRFSVYAVAPSSVPPGSSTEAAAIAAAYTVLIARLPLQAASLGVDYSAMLGGIPDGPAKSNGVAIGVEVGNGILSHRAGDGLDAATPAYAFGNGPGVYQRIPIFEPRTDPILKVLVGVRPFAILGASQFRADGPPALTSEEWANDYNEVKELGAKNSSTRTDAQTQLAISYTENPLNYYTRIFRNVAAAQGLSLEDNARLFAMLHLAQADSFIAIFDSKYHFNFWRPYTAIHGGDTDGNLATDLDSTWAPLAVTPPHPEYPAAHGVQSGTVAEVLRTFFGTKRITIAFTPVLPGYTAGEITHSSTDEMIKEVIEGRILGGMHYRTSGRHGTIIGRKVAHWIAEHYFQPVGRHEENEEGNGGGLGRTMVVEGDSNADTVVDLSDAVQTLDYLFGQTGAPACLRASDANDDGAVDISDPVYTLNFLFLGGPAPRPTLPEPTDDDPFADRLGCEVEG
jgi:hypothetical protein